MSLVSLRCTHILNQREFPVLKTRCNRKSSSPPPLRYGVHTSRNTPLNPPLESRAVSFDKEGGFVNIIRDNFWDRSHGKPTFQSKKFKFFSGYLERSL